MIKNTNLIQSNKYCQIHLHYIFYLFMYVVHVQNTHLSLEVKQQGTTCKKWLLGVQWLLLCVYKKSFFWMNKILGFACYFGTRYQVVPSCTFCLDTFKKNYVIIDSILNYVYIESFWFLNDFKCLFSLHHNTYKPVIWNVIHLFSIN